MKKVVLVTGSSSNLGKLLVRQLAQKEYIIYAGARNTKELSDLSNEYSNIKVVVLDITKDKDCQDVVDTIKSKEKRLDVLINNAGYTLTGPTDQFSSKDFLDILNTNAVGAFRMIRGVTPLMKKKGKGQIINITSLNGLVSLPNFGLYSGSKFALEALGRAFYYELKGSGIRVTNVEPGAINMGINTSGSKLHHTPAREKFLIIKLLLPMVKGEKVVEEIVALIENPNPPVSLTLGRDAKMVSFLNRYFPLLWNRMLQGVWSK